MTRDRPLLHPIALAALAILIVNDHVLKDLWPGVVTGKLSDFAGLVFFPLLVCTLVRRVSITAVIAATGIGFAAIKLWQPATALCELVLGMLQWPFRALAAGAFVAVEPVDIVRDPTDLVALVALAVPWWITRRPGG
jgi:hypothetical protein